MSNKVSKLPASPRIHNLLEKEHTKGTIGVTYKLRLSIILNGIKGLSNYKSHKDLGISKITVKKWRAQWEEPYEVLLAMENKGVKEDGLAVMDHKIIKQIKIILADKPRSGKPKRITLAQQEQIVALATEKPEDHNVPFTNWTHEMLAHVAISEGIVDKISRRHIGTILKKKN